MTYQEHFSVVSFLMVELTAVLSCSVLAALPHFHRIAFLSSQTPLNYCKLPKWQSPALQPRGAIPASPSLSCPLYLKSSQHKKVNRTILPKMSHTVTVLWLYTRTGFHGQICARQTRDRKAALLKLLSGWVIKTTSFPCISFHFIVTKMTSKGG